MYQVYKSKSPVTTGIFFFLNRSISIKNKTIQKKNCPVYLLTVVISIYKYVINVCYIHNVKWFQINCIII